MNGKNPQGQILPCNSDTTLMSQTGQVTVDANDNPNNPHPNNPLYTNGFLQVSGHYLTFTDSPNRRFYWQGDTAWASLSLEGQKRLTQSGRVPGQVTPTWQGYVDDRSALGFTVLQVAPAVAWQPKINEPMKPSCAAQKNLDYSPGGTTSWGEFTPATAALVEVVTPPKPTDPALGERRILTGTKDDVFLSYLPNNPVVNVVGSLGFKCNTWTAEWRDIKGTQAFSPLCPKGTQTQFKIPVSCSDRSLGDRFGACDWLMFMRRPRSSGSGLTAVGPDGSYLQVTVVDGIEGDPADGSPDTSLIAQVVTGDGAPISAQTSVGMDGTSQYGQPTVATDGQQGTFWVVWEAETGDDSTTDVFAHLIGPDGNPIGDVFQVNQWVQDSQFDPFTLIDTAGSVTVVWTSQGQDGDQGGIFARRFQMNGAPVGDEFQVNMTAQGDQESARGGTDSAGDVVIAWRSGDSMINARIYSSTGAPLTGEISVSSTSQGREELVELDVAPLGGFSAHWEVYSADDQFLGRYVRNFDATGSPLGDETVEAPQ